jgi:hypothetical protein
MKHSLRGATSLLWLALSLISAASMAYYVTELWAANQPAGFSDLYARWWGAHELFLHGRDPYSPAVSHEIQTVIYGAPVTPSADDPMGLGGGFAYPPYTAFLLWPTVYTPFSVAQAIFACLSVPLTALSLTLWLRVLGRRLSVLHWMTTAFFVVGCFPALEAMKLQNLSLLAAASISIGIFLIASDHLIWAGVILALSTFKPQFMVALLPWLLLWTIADWRRRSALVWSFVGTMLVLVLASEWFVPGWVTSFLFIARAYRHYAYGYSVLDVWFSPTFGPIVSAILLVVVLALCWRQRLQTAGSPGFFLATSLVLATNVVVMPTLAPHAQLLLLPGFLCLLPGGHASSNVRPTARVLRMAAWTLLAWGWVGAFGLGLARLRLPAVALLRFWQVPLYTSPVVPVAVSLALTAIAVATPIAENMAGNLDPVPVVSHRA